MSAYPPIDNTALFYDIPMNTLDANVHKDYIIARILEEGSMTDVLWMKKKYTSIEIAHVVATSRTISRRTALFWKQALDIHQHIVCLSPQPPNTLWKN
ncbi:MAG: hypothetical protein WCO78_03015 [Candidatus Roizmanbacteria bacterium]